MRIIKAVAKDIGPAARPFNRTAPWIEVIKTVLPIAEADYLKLRPFSLLDQIGQEEPAKRKKASERFDRTARIELGWSVNEPLPCSIAALQSLVSLLLPVP